MSGMLFAHKYPELDISDHHENSIGTIPDFGPKNVPSSVATGRVGAVEDSQWRSNSPREYTIACSYII